MRFRFLYVKNSTKRTHQDKNPENFLPNQQFSSYVKRTLRGYQKYKKYFWTAEFSRRFVLEGPVKTTRDSWKNGLMSCIKSYQDKGSLRVDIVERVHAQENVPRQQGKKCAGNFKGISLFFEEKKTVKSKKTNKIK
jgi:hypothetical protein